ncbi:cobyric acid synthase [Alicyclobacillus mengziensis]|uniref:Cobyric acid synthase n=1 Tax=Alicyclobacillus mengziensis TaxID=2931921 RepID=A0A9X7Z7L7_9BACL|nr:cobyric acid synthase [Alicyclobacillus mengziensis]QSO47495.1 cobyric acid synthase [Alicyclobacillus mengziensis]
MTRSLMVVGTSSNVGKSILAAALCRILTQDGHRVAPFKAQNMSLNSAVTPSGREIGRAQAVQAEACGILSNEHMNPVLLKPTGNMQSQIVLQGRSMGTRSAKDYFYDEKELLWKAVVESYQFLAQRHDIIVIEGAGSPVEMNLKQRDMANMRTAQMADAGVLLIADIDRGGVFASIVGTLQLLDPDEKRLVKGILINKFRGDARLFDEGRRWLEDYTGVPVLGLIPYIPNLAIDEEDSVGMSGDRYHQAKAIRNGIRVGIVQLPYISNFTDFDPLFLEPGVDASFCTQPEDLNHVDAIVIPGTKSTLMDLSWLHDNGWAASIQRSVQGGAHVLGICGGYQMLGIEVHDPEHLESEIDTSSGLGFFDAVTTMYADKTTVLVEGEFAGEFTGIPVKGYEIHMGVTKFSGTRNPLAMTYRVYSDGVHTSPSDSPIPEGQISTDGRITGTYLHGLLHNDIFRNAWLNRIRRNKGLPLQEKVTNVRAVRSEEFDRLAQVVRTHLDMSKLYDVLGLT